MQWLLITLFILLFGIGCDTRPTEQQDKPALHEHAGHQHAANDLDDHDDHDGHEHNDDKHDHGKAPASWQEIQQKKCEHGILQIECAGCRGELGVVKVEQDVAQKLIKTSEVQSAVPSQQLEFVGEVRVNQLNTVVVVPIVAGQITQVAKRLGEEVKQGELLAVIHSQEYGRMKSEFLFSCQRERLAQKNLDLVIAAHTNLHKLLDTLRNGSAQVDLPMLVNSLKIGAKKERVIETAATYRMTKAKYEREQKVIENVQRMLDLLSKPDGVNQLISMTETWALGEWRSKLWGAASRLVLAEKNYQREKNLMQSKSSTQKELQEAESVYQAARADYQGMTDEMSLWVPQKKAELQSEFDSALARYLSIMEEMDVDVQLHKLEAEKESQEASYQKATAEKQLYLLGLSPEAVQGLQKQGVNAVTGTLELRAPIGGTVIASDIAEGQFIEAQRPLYTISRLDTLWVWCDLYDSDLVQIQPWQNRLAQLAARVKTSASAGDIAGKVDYLAHVVDERTRTVKMRVVVADPNRSLRPGMFVQIVLTLPFERDMRTVPVDAVLFDQKQSFLFKQAVPTYWLRTDVKLGQRIGDRYEVVAGLSDGDIIVSEGVFLLKSELFKSKMGSG